MSSRGTKRGGPSNDSDNQGDLHPSKKTRFAEDDATEEGLTLPAKSNKGVKLQGYESDSGSETDQPAANNAEDEDDDMFAASEPKPAAADDTDRINDGGLAVKEGTDTKKGFLAVEDILGQEFGDNEEAPAEGVQMVVEDGSEVEGSDEEYVSGDELANADDAPRSRRTKRGMGYVISKFNLADVYEEGRIDGEGNFVANSNDPFSAHDVWLSGVSSKSDIHKARKAKQEREAKANLQDAADKGKTRAECLKELLEQGLLLKEGNKSVMATLQALGQEKKQLTKKTLQGKSKNSMALDEDEEEQKRKRLDELTIHINRLTALASLLLDAYGEGDIYDQSYEDIVKTLRLEGEVPRGWEPAMKTNTSATSLVPSSSSQGPAKRGIINRDIAEATSAPGNRRWFYKWRASAGVDPLQVEKEFGPFSTEEVRAWAQQGFFGTDATNIQVRQENGTEWEDWKLL